MTLMANARSHVAPTIKSVYLMNSIDPDSEFQSAQREFLRMVEGMEEFFGRKDLKAVSCSFCGRSKAEVMALVGGLQANICDQCVEQAHRLIKGRDSELSGGNFKG